jgi:hypothetical protein
MRQVEECEESFRKRCFIEYHNRVYEKIVEICHEPITRDCDSEDGEIVCQTDYETSEKY